MYSRKLRRGMVVLTVATLTACTTLNPYTREEETSNAAKGAAIGAVVGAIAGAASGDDSAERRERALIGAGVGALSGAGIGYYMDVQEAKLRKRLEGTGVSVTREGDNVILNMPASITFEYDSAALNAGFFEVLDSVALVLEEYEKTVIEVAGHTDSTGSDSYNTELSVRRAETVGRYLVSRRVDTRRVLPLGYGENRPIATNATAEGRAQNRRVELTLIPVTED